MLESGRASESDGASGEDPACQCKRHKGHGFKPWVGKIPWRRPCQPTPVFLPGESHGQPGGLPRIAKSWTQLKRNILIPSLESKYLEHLLHFMDEKTETLYGEELQGYEASLPF